MYLNCWYKYVQHIPIFLFYKVYNSASGELVGFINNRPGTLATHVLTFMVVGLNPSSNLKFVAGYFGTTNATADDLFPLFWKCVSLMELKCGLQVSFPLKFFYYSLFLYYCLQPKVRHFEYICTRSNLFHPSGTYSCPNWIFKNSIQ